MRVDPTAFRSEQLPVEHFDRRFSPENLAFWVPVLVERARIDASTKVLDVGCGTGGFAREIARTTGAPVTGLERSAAFLDHARTAGGDVEWVQGDAEELPFADASFDRLLLSLVLHQLARPERAVAEAARVLRPGGIVLVRTIAPADVAERVPERYLPSVAAADSARLPELATIEGWLRAGGLTQVDRSRHVRNKRLDVDEQERELLAEVEGRYPFVGPQELAVGIAQMRADAERAGGTWIDPRPGWILSATRRLRERRAE